MKLFNSSQRWFKWWAKRKIDWGKEYMNPEHPHRELIAETLLSMHWKSLVEVGCGAGANLVRILKLMPERQVAGVDINPEAIAYLSKQIGGALLKVGPADDTPLSDQMCDVVLTDMLMIYVSPGKMKKHLKEFKRIGRRYVIFCELYSPSWWDRFVIKWKEGYNVYDWPRLLEKHEFYDIKTFKIPKQFWPESDLQQRFAAIIVARTPKFY